MTTITPEERAQWRKESRAEYAHFSQDGRRLMRALDALEAAEARADESEASAEKVEAWATRLVWTVTDGRMSKLYDIEVIEEEIDTLWGERISQEVFEAEQRAEAAEGQREQVMRQKANLETERAALVREVQIYTDRHVRIMSKAEELLETCRREVMGHTDYTAAHSDGYESALVAILDEMKEASAQEVAKQAAGKKDGES